MTPNEYQELTKRTMNYVEAMGPEDALKVNMALGLSDEAGEVAGVIKKQFFHGHPADPEKVKDELSDVAWYLARLSDLYGLKLEDVFEYNIHKLRVRYPDRFTTEASIARVDVAKEF